MHGNWMAYIESKQKESPPYGGPGAGEAGKVSTRLRAATSAQKRKTRRECERRPAGYPWQASMISSLGVLSASLGHGAKLPSHRPAKGSLECTTSRGNANTRKACGRQQPPPRPFVRKKTDVCLSLNQKHRPRGYCELDSIAKGRRGPAWRLAGSGHGDDPDSEPLKGLYFFNAPRGTTQRSRATAKFENTKTNGHGKMNDASYGTPALSSVAYKLFPNDQMRRPSRKQATI
ncbi:hypothetical protein HPB50_004448 [Hyalomma asiaticum]|uniref:Uncharacterized protein n=1 Tax=Hyalomma asiaticum TaxID=266040 RepID=A0ACB7TC04_HYAAI|nr:hypothetical protein HPB50_004448 [Hyalomma asiaticum]